MKLKVYYQNVRGLRTKTDEFMDNLIVAYFDLIILCETWLHDHIFDGELFDERYVVYRNDRDPTVTNKNRGGGCLIAVRKDIKSRRESDFEIGQEDIWVAIDHVDGNKSFFNVKYIPCKSVLSVYEPHLRRINEIINEKEPNSNFLLCGDYNLEASITWVRRNDVDCLCKATDIKGDVAHAIVDTQSLTNLEQFNYVKNKIERVLDLVLSNYDSESVRLSRTKSPFVCEDDHHPALEISLDTSPVKCIGEKRSRKPNFFIANYLELAAKLVLIDWVSRFQSLSANHCLQVFNEILKRLIDELPKSTGSNRQYPRWYSKELIQLIAEKSRARARKIGGTQSDIDVYKRLRRTVKQKISECHDNYVRNTEDKLKVNTKCFFSYTKSIRKTNALPTTLRHDDCTVNDKSSACDLFARFFNSVYQESGTSDDISDHRSVGRACLNDIIVSEKDVHSILNSFDCNKMSSPDDIPMIFYVRLRDVLSLPLSIIFNKSLAEGVFPEIWKLSFISPIYKSGRKSDVTNYRPISIICASAKVLEKLIFQAVFQFVKSSINSCQHGFFVGRSVQTNLVEHISFLCHNVMNGGQVDTIYTDFSKAFDMVDHRLLIIKLRDIGIGGNLLTWFKSYLSCRSQCVVLGNSRSFIINPSSGVPQGSVLGPLLFLIFVNDLVERLNSKSLQLADDLKISRRIDTVQDCLIMQNDVDTLRSWCSNNRINLNAGKCSVLTMTHKPTKILYDYTIGSVTLSRVTSKKDLGVIFDEKLSFSDHLDKVTRKAYQMLGFIFRSCKRFRNPESIITLYKAYVRSHLEYCSVVWSPIYQNAIDKLEKVQRKFTRMLFRKFNWQKVDYPQRLERLKIPLLESRRYIADEIFLFKVVNHRFSVALDGEVVFFDSGRSTRQAPRIFYPPVYNSNIESNAPIVRMQLNHDKLFSSVDIFASSLTTFRSRVKDLFVL